ncbi:class I SAM-dependent methyltransferase [uncultured Jatrophihabitans sp.]|uniref:class I SAM-dependent methyltransferase n=1 Tax=uncultured Jatrophihabitans sp. TaxID=1610747 RepID=UPI0035CB34E0
MPKFNARSLEASLSDTKFFDRGARRLDAVNRKIQRRANNPLRQYFENNDQRMINKWLHYFDIYHRHVAPFRDRPVTLLEFGVWQGGSLQMWRDYLGPKARIVGVDINPACAELTGPQIEVVIGDQNDREFLAGLAKRLGKVDILIEDGGHHPQQQINTFEIFWPIIKNNGIFLIEDLHTSYWERYGGGLRGPLTFIEYAKGLVDQMHAWYGHELPDLNPDVYTKTIRGMHVYDSIIVFDKAKQIKKPTQKKTGYASF